MDKKLVVAEKIYKAVNEYIAATGKNPTTLYLSQSDIAELVHDIFRLESVKINSLEFAGMKVVVSDRSICVE